MTQDSSGQQLSVIHHDATTRLIMLLSLPWVRLQQSFAEFLNSLHNCISLHSSVRCSNNLQNTQLCKNLCKIVNYHNLAQLPPLTAKKINCARKLKSKSWEYWSSDQTWCLKNICWSISWVVILALSEECLYSEWSEPELSRIICWSSVQWVRETQEQTTKTHLRQQHRSQIIFMRWIKK